MKYTAAEAEAMLLKSGAIPLEPYPHNMTKPWKCRCIRCGETVYPRMGSIARRRHACRHCYGPNHGNPKSIVYLLHNEDMAVAKIGVGNSSRGRLKDYGGGWTVVALIETATRQEAEQIEKQVLDLWRDELGLGQKLKREEMSNGGHTETADEAGIGPALELLTGY